MQKMALFKLIYTKPLIGLVLSVLLLNLQFSLGEKNYFENLKHSNEMLNCGRVISSCAKGENELFIGYKFNKPVEKWERCSWIVAIPNATRFTIEPVLNGLKNQAAGLLALGINDKDDLVSHDLDEGISRNITVNANYLHIIFWTNGLPGSRGYPEINGFVLRVYVETATSSNTTLLPRSRVHLLAGDVKEFVHPASLKQNDAYLSSTELDLDYGQEKELTVVVMHPGGNRLLPNAQEITFSYRKLESVRQTPCELQTVKVFQFSVSPDGHASWQFRYLYCEDVKKNELDVSDVVLVVIESSRQDKDSVRAIELGYVRID